MQNPVHVTVIVLLGAILIGGALYARHDSEQDFPVVVRATYEPVAGGNIPDIDVTYTRRRNSAELVQSTLRNPLRRPEGIEVCPLVERGLALRVGDDEYDTNSLRDCELTFRTDRFFELERAIYTARRQAQTEE